jgi:hypothetical protein
VKNWLQLWLSRCGGQGRPHRNKFDFWYPAVEVLVEKGEGWLAVGSERCEVEWYCSEQHLNREIKNAARLLTAQQWRGFPMWDDEAPDLSSAEIRVQKLIRWLNEIQTRASGSEQSLDSCDRDPATAHFPDNDRTGNQTSPKKIKNTRPRDLDCHGKECLKLYTKFKDGGDRRTLKDIVQEYVRDHPDVKISTTLRRISDHRRRQRK